MTIIKKMWVGAVLLCGLQLNAHAKTYRMAMVTPPSHVFNKVSAVFNDNLQKATSGKDSIKIFPLGQLGSDDQVINLLQSGGVQLAVLTAASVSNRVEGMNAWFLPYIFHDVAEAAKAAQSNTGKKLLNDLTTIRLVGLGYALAGMRHVLSVDPLVDAASFENKKIRAFPNVLHSDWWKALGAAPTALAIGDVSSALSTHLLDGVDVDLDIVVGLKMYQQAPNLSLTNHMAFPGIVVASKKWWDTLSSDKQDVIRKAFKEAEVWGYKQQELAEKSNLQLLKEAGVNVIAFDQSTLTDAAERVVKRYINKSTDIKEFYEAEK